MSKNNQFVPFENLARVDVVDGEELVFFHTINFVRKANLVDEDGQEGAIAKLLLDANNINATAVILDDGSNNPPSIEIYANSDWKNFPSYLFLDPLFVGAWPNDINSDSFYKNKSLEQSLSKQKGRDSTPLARKASMTSVVAEITAAMKSKKSLKSDGSRIVRHKFSAESLREKLLKIHARRNLASVADVEPKYYDEAGNLITIASYGKYGDGDLPHNECHVKIMTHNIEALVFTYEDFYKSPIDGALWSNIFRTLKMADQLNAQRSGLLGNQDGEQFQALVNFELEKRKLAQEKINDLSDTIKVYEMDLRACKEGVEPYKYNKDLPIAFANKRKKTESDKERYPHPFDVTNPENRRIWLEHNIKKLAKEREILQAELTELEGLDRQDVQAQIAQKLEKKIGIQVYQKSSSSLREYSDLDSLREIVLQNGDKKYILQYLLLTKAPEDEIRKAVFAASVGNQDAAAADLQDEKEALYVAWQGDDRCFEKSIAKLLVDGGYSADFFIEMLDKRDSEIDPNLEFDGYSTEDEPEIFVQIVRKTLADKTLPEGKKKERVAKLKFVANNAKTFASLLFEGYDFDKATVFMDGFDVKEFLTKNNVGDEDKEFLLYKAVAFNQQALAKLIVKKLRDRDESRDDAVFIKRTSALHFAAERGDVKVLQLLISDYGAKSDQLDEFGRTPLDVALQNGEISQEDKAKISQILSASASLSADLPLADSRAPERRESDLVQAPNLQAPERRDAPSSTVSRSAGFFQTLLSCCFGRGNN